MEERFLGENDVHVVARQHKMQSEIVSAYFHALEFLSAKR